MSVSPKVRIILNDSSIRAVKRMNEIAVSPGGIEYMTDKSVHRFLLVEDLKVQAANFLKQEMLSRGGDALISYQALSLKGQRTNCLLHGTEKAFQNLIPKLMRQAFGLKKLAMDMQDVFETEHLRVKTLTIRGRTLVRGQSPWIVGIVNLTPDSFYDGGKYKSVDEIVHHVKAMEEEGADVIELGAQSAVPGRPISAEVEKSRLMPALRKVRKITDLPISVDTYRADIALAAMRAGADIINDITSLSDPKMAGIVAKTEAYLVLMHIKGKPKIRQTAPKYGDVMSEIAKYLRDRAVTAVSAGVPEGNIVIDPGIGFGKNTEHNLTVVSRLSELRTLGFPVMFAGSHKSFIGEVLGTPVSDRLEGTIAANVLALLAGADLFRVHNVKENRRALDVAHAIRTAEG